MRKVIDSNQLQSDDLRSYLSKSETHFAVLTDYAAIEVYKKDTLAGTYTSMEIVGSFPAQIIVLKSTRIIRRYARRLADAKKGDLSFERQLLKTREHATEHIDRMLANPKATATGRRGASRFAMRFALWSRYADGSPSSGARSARPRRSSTEEPPRIRTGMNRDDPV